MVQIIRLTDLNENSKLKEQIISEIKSGKIFIYPTDTIYGIGCNALIPEAVEKIKQIKERDREKPLSIIAPSTDWINEKLNLSKEDKEAIKKYLPGAYTILLKKKENSFLDYVSTNERIGVRIPDCNFTEIITDSNVPFITTSVNLAGETFAVYIEDITKELIGKVDYIIETNAGLSGKPSTLIIDGKEMARK